jgi:hypothetical protein
VKERLPAVYFPTELLVSTDVNVTGPDPGAATKGTPPELVIESVEFVLAATCSAHAEKLGVLGSL